MDKPLIIVYPNILHWQYMEWLDFMGTCWENGNPHALATLVQDLRERCNLDRPRIS